MLEESNRKSYIDKMHEELTHLNSQLETVKKKIEAGAEGVRGDFEHQLNHLKGKESELKQRLTEIQAAGEEKFEALKEGAHTIWTDIKQLFKNLENPK
jgi:chromosome segregation ATPase